MQLNSKFLEDGKYTRRSLSSVVVIVNFRMPDGIGPEDLHACCRLRRISSNSILRRLVIERKGNPKKPIV
jgi:hypothetical protein